MLRTHVRFADEAVCVGPGPSSESYLNIPNIIAAEITSLALFIQAMVFFQTQVFKVCQEKAKFIGASPEMIEGMGDKAAAKDTMKKAGVPTIPGSDGLIENLTHCKVS